MLSAISPITHQQADLLDKQPAGNEKLMLAVDSLNARFGRGAGEVSTQGAYQGWQMKQERKLPNYTTSWDEVPLV